MTELIKQLLKQEWYAQGFNSTPMLLVSAAISGHILKKQIGFGYNAYIFHFKNDYGEMFYNKADLKKIYYKLMIKYNQDKNYFKKIKKRYDEIMAEHFKFYKKLDKTDLRTLSDNELIKITNKVVSGTTSSVGMGHVIEAFSITTESEIRHSLRKQMGDEKMLNKYLSILMATTKKSFVNEEEEELYRISKISQKSRQEKELEKHTKNFFWIRNNYANADKLTIQDFRKEMKSLKNYKPMDFKKIKKDKKELIKKLKLNKEFIETIKHIEFFMQWQDERKKKIIISLYYNQCCLYELSRRFKIDKRHIKYLTYTTISTKTLKSKNINKILAERKKGCLFATALGKVEVYTGKDYKKYYKELTYKEETAKTTNLHGTAASTGTAIGRVVICTSLKLIKNVKKGDILVSSMTRPEHVPAMKKAAAIITDEGGVTCHAAILSRELGIPCVVGTKFATKILKNGDLVEVRASHGLVTIIERNGGKNES